MKKIIVMLLAVSLLCTGCGNTDTPTESSEPVADNKEKTVEAEVTKDTDTVQQKPIDKQEVIEENTDEPVIVDQPQNNEVVSEDNKVTHSQDSTKEPTKEITGDDFPLKHDNAEVDPNGWYFDKDIFTQKDSISVLFDPYTFKGYKSYTTQWTFDGLDLKTSPNDEKTKVNLEKIAKEVKDAYMASEDRNPDYTDVIYNSYDDSIVQYWGIYIAGPETEKDGMYSQNGDYIAIFHSAEDAPNGVTIHLIKDCSNRDLISAYRISYETE